MRLISPLLLYVILALGSACSPDAATLTQQADTGDAAAQLKLGSMYASGVGVAKDLLQAAVLFRKAADQGNPDAMYMLGLSYGAGRGVKQSWAESYTWLAVVATLTGANHQKEYTKSRDEVASWLTPSQLAEAQKRADEWVAEFQTRVKK
jgi:TPR repeat protein